jgi:hypothetical protein
VTRFQYNVNNDFLYVYKIIKIIKKFVLKLRVLIVSFHMFIKLK